MEMILTIIAIIFGILQFILFFKLWGMTNDIREIKNKYLNYDKDSLGEDQPVSRDQPIFTFKLITIISFVFLFIRVIVK
jgi:hypothetical protein